MCVTNTTFRRQQPISLPQQQQQQPQHQPAVSTGSGLTQRLLSTFQLSAASVPQNVSYARSAAVAPAEFYALPSKAGSDIGLGGLCPNSSSISGGGGKPRPKRRRKPQKPGKTAKMNDRHFVVHNYHDHAQDPDESTTLEGATTAEKTTSAQHEEEHSQQHRRKGGVAVAFPLKLHAVLDQVEADGLAHVMSWSPHGRCFVIHKPKEFTEHVMPKYFRQTKLTSFQRQLNLYGFSRLTRGPDASGYYHELFLRGKTHLCKRMVRTKVKGTKFKAASSPDQEPDFYKMPTVSPPTTSDEEMSHDSSSHGTSTCSRGSSVTSPTMAPTVPSSLSTASVLYNPPSALSSSLSCSLEPLPLSFAAAAVNSQQQQPTLTVPPLPYAPTTAPIPPPGGSSSNSNFTFEIDADQILDQTVDELFLQEGSSGDLMEFSNDWSSGGDPPLNSAFAESLENDQQLGFMLEKLLED